MVFWLILIVGVGALAGGIMANKKGQTHVSGILLGVAIVALSYIVYCNLPT